jgi:hypothetical protein
MKPFILVLWLLFVQALISQEIGEDPLYPDTECTLQVTNSPYSTIVFDFIPIGTIFCRHDVDCNNFDPVSNPQSYNHTLITGETGDTLCDDNGFDIRYCSEDTSRKIIGCAFPTSGLTPLRWGFYKINVKVNNVQKGYFYIDWRDNGIIVGNECNPGCSSNNITIRYDGENQKIKFFNNGVPRKEV